jgi:hypothetical protein
VSRFAVVYEDPDYEDWADSLESDEGDWVEDGGTDIMTWLNIQIDGATVKQEEYSPFVTINS